ncbi:MAG TPA: hypothetical protein VHP14_03420 [Anaerolineales bacterium]|nr:hypothetical protein [Anaerolineales bacterium]
MNPGQLEKQFQLWNRLMYMVLGGSITLLLISFGNLVVYRNTWPGFDNYTGGVWMCLQLLTVLPGLYLLWDKPWRPLALGARLNTAFGYFVAGWFCILALSFIIDPQNTPNELIFIIIGSAIVIALGYIWTLKRTLTPREEIFP